MGFVTYAILLELSTQPSGRHVEAGRNDAEYVIGSHIIVRDILIKPVLRWPSACYGEAVYVISWCNSQCGYSYWCSSVAAVMVVLCDV